MSNRFNKLNKDTLKEQFKKEIQRLIISGEIKEGEQLPPERELASLLGISRGVINAGIIELSAQGLLRIVPRRGTFVSNFEECGSLSALELLLNYSDGEINKALFLNMIEVKRQLESRCAFLAALNRSQEDLDVMHNLIAKMQAEKNIDALADLNYLFHHQIAIATKNSVYSLLDKSIEPVSKNIIRHFYQKESTVKKSIVVIRLIYDAILDGHAEEASAHTTSIFDFGESLISQPQNI